MPRRRSKRSTPAPLSALSTFLDSQRTRPATSPYRTNPTDYDPQTLCVNCGHGPKVGLGGFPVSRQRERKACLCVCHTLPGGRTMPRVKP